MSESDCFVRNVFWEQAEKYIEEENRDETRFIVRAMVVELLVTLIVVIFSVSRAYYS